MANVILEHPATGHRLALDPVRSQAVADEIARVSPGPLTRLANWLFPVDGEVPAIVPDAFLTVSQSPVAGDYMIQSAIVLRRSDLGQPMQFHMGRQILTWIADDLP